MSGLQVHRHLAAAGYRVPILIITTSDDKESFLYRPCDDGLLLNRFSLPHLFRPGFLANLHGQCASEQTARDWAHPHSKLIEHSSRTAYESSRAVKLGDLRISFGGRIRPISTHLPRRKPSEPPNPNRVVISREGTPIFE